MTTIRFIDRVSGKIQVEAVYGEWALRLLYGPPAKTLGLGSLLKHLVGQSAWISKLYGWLQSLPFSRRKVVPFIQRYHVDASEFAKPVANFTSFNDFFIRKLKPEARPITPGDDVAILPADGRYLVSPNLTDNPHFYVKGQTFDLRSFLQDENLTQRYAGGSLVLARLCPTDYHRFHFPCDALPSSPKLINGFLFSVNPIALGQQLSILWENRRFICELETPSFGKILFVEIGATNVGSVHQTFQPNQFHKKGSEKGFFSFGGSSIVLLFEKDKINFDQDLIDASNKGLEIRGLMGQRLGVASEKS